MFVTWEKLKTKIFILFNFISFFTKRERKNAERQVMNSTAIFLENPLEIQLTTLIKQINKEEDEEKTTKTTI